MTPEQIGVGACYGLLVLVAYAVGRVNKRRRESGRR